MNIRKIKDRVQSWPPPAHPLRQIFVITAGLAILGGAAGIAVPAFMIEFTTKYYEFALYAGALGFSTQFMLLGVFLLPPVVRWRVLLSYFALVPLLLVFLCEVLRRLSSFKLGEMDRLLHWTGIVVTLTAVVFVLPPLWGWLRWATEDDRKAMEKLRAMS